MAKLKVKKISDGSFGITDGKKWFAYSYKTEAIANQVLPKLAKGNTKINICWKEPVQISKIANTLDIK